MLVLALAGCGALETDSVSEGAVGEEPSTAANDEPGAAHLRDEVEGLAQEVPGELGFVLLAEDGGEVMTVNADRSFTSASLYKLFVAEVILEQVDQGSVELSEIVPGLTLTVDQALQEMLSRSRNYPGAAMGEWLGWAQIEKTVQAHGFGSTTFDPDNGIDGVVDLHTTSSDVAGLLDRVNRGELLEPSSADVLIGYLADQELNYALPQGLSADVEFAHKTGLLEEVSHDAGILRLDGQDHTVAVLTDGWSGYEDSRPWFRDMGETLDAYLHATTATPLSTANR